MAAFGNIYVCHFPHPYNNSSRTKLCRLKRRRQAKRRVNDVVDRPRIGSEKNVKNFTRTTCTLGSLDSYSFQLSHIYNKRYSWCVLPPPPPPSSSSSSPTVFCCVMRVCSVQCMGRYILYDKAYIYLLHFPISMVSVQYVCVTDWLWVWVRV